MNALVFSDPLGPRGRRRVRVATGVAAVAVAVLVFVALRRFADRGQLDGDLWEPLFSGDAVEYFGVGLLNTLRAALVAMVLASLAGLVLALLRLSSWAPVRVAAIAWIEFFRGIPLVLLILFLFFGLPRYGLDVGRYWFLVMALVLYNSAVIAEIVRAGILSIGSGQSQAARALGLTEAQTMRLVVLPQALRRMIPAMVSQLVILLKDTSLGVVISYEELLRRGQLAGTSLDNRLQSLLLAAFIYLLVNLALSRLAAWLERRQARRPRSAAEGPLTVDDAGMPADLAVGPT